MLLREDGGGEDGEDGDDDDDDDDDLYRRADIRGRTISYYANDTCIGQAFAQGRYWNVELLSIMRQHRICNRSMLDIGAYIGSSSLLMMELLEPERGVVHAFEPTYFDGLRRNICENGYQERIIAHRCGLASVEGDVPSARPDMRQKANYGGQHLLVLHDESDVRRKLCARSDLAEESVPLRRLDSFDLRDIGFVKLDVEGMELEVLKGGVETLRNSNYPPIYVEIWEVECWRRNHADYYARNRYETVAFLMGLGYVLEARDGHDHLFVHPQ